VRGEVPDVEGFVRRVFLGAAVLLILLSPAARAAHIPIVFSFGVAIPDMSRSVIAVNSQGEYYLLKIGSGPVVKLDNDLREIDRFPLPAEFVGSFFFNEIAVDSADNVVISHGDIRGSGSNEHTKVLLTFDGDGNFLASATHVNSAMTFSFSLGFVFDRAGNVFFVNSRPGGFQQPSEPWISKVDPSTGTLLGQWELMAPEMPGGFQSSGMVMNDEGRIIFGDRQSKRLFIFDPATGQTALFAEVDELFGAVSDFALDAEQTIYLLDDPTANRFVFILERDGTFGERVLLEVGSGDTGFGIAVFGDEVVITAKDSGQVLKYGLTTIEQTIKTIESGVAAGDIGENTAARLIRTLLKARNWEDRGDIGKAVQVLERFQKLVLHAVDQGKTTPEFGDIVLEMADGIIFVLLNPLL
jgi:hypothetical protein